ncbi:MAG: aldo/keto reductase [bacterium]
MELRRLGKTGLEVSAIGFGGIPIRKLGRKEARKLVRLAREYRINFFDTAQGYGDSEVKIGEGIKGRRKECFLATKSPCRDFQQALKDVDAALRRLQVEVIDLYQVHFVNDSETLDRVIEPNGSLKGLKKAKEEGKINHIGITGHNADVLLRAIENEDFETVQVPFNIIEDGPDERALLKAAKEQGVGVICMKPLAGGVIAEPELSLRWILAQGVSTVIPGMIQSHEVESNALVGTSPLPLSEKELERLKKVCEPLEENFCRRCMYCMPCPEGIPIYLIQELGDKVKVPQVRELSRDIYARQKVNVEACTDCGECEEKCPYHLPIREMLKEKHLLLAG